MDNLSYILNQIILPVISLYSNEKIKFPNGYLMRQVLAYKILDIILLLSLRIGPEQTRIEMETTLKAYFDAFSLVRSKILSFKTKSFTSKPVRIEKQKSSGVPTAGLISKQTFSRVGSSHYKTRNSVFARTQQHSKDSIIQSFISTSELNDSMENSNEQMNMIANSYDDFLKYSYDKSTDEIVAQQVSFLNYSAKMVNFFP